MPETPDHRITENPAETITPQRWEDDPIYRTCLREAAVILSMWLFCFVWTVTYCYVHGYMSHEPLPEGQSFGPDIAHAVGPLESFNRDASSLTTPFNLGIPDWIFYGVVLPWITCIFASLVFCFFVFSEDDLSGESDDQM